MKWKERKSRRDCAAQPLAQLVRDELDEKQSERLATHLDNCGTCQQRLTILAADSQWWLDAGRWLDPAAGGMESSNNELDCDSYSDHDSHYSCPEKDLLSSGLLAASDKADCIGTLGRYEVQSVLGAGGTGVVLKANDVELNRTVAIKVLSPSLSTSGAARRRFAREAQAVAAVAHDNVIAVHQVEGDGLLPYLVMQYVDGDSLQDLVTRDGPLDITTALRMTAQIASALSAAHDQGLVHRDVKPANILVGAAGQRVWITDFGLARAVDDASLTRTGFIAGTPHYMSPEQARGEAVRASSDLFGLGSVLYFMLTGRPPFRAERTLAILNRICNEPHRPVREVNPDVPPVIADLVDWLLNKSAEDRIADASSVRTHCLSLLAALAEPDGDLSSIELRGRPDVPASPSVPTGSRRRRSRYATWAVSLLVLIGFSAAVSAYVGRSRQDTVGHMAPPPTTESLAIEAQADVEESNVVEADTLLDSVVAARVSREPRNEGEQRKPIVPETVKPDRARGRRPASNGAWQSDLSARGATPPQLEPTSELPRSEAVQSGWRPASPAMQPSDRAAHGSTPRPPEPVFQLPSSNSGRKGREDAQGEATSLPLTSTDNDMVVEEETSLWTADLNNLRAAIDCLQLQMERPSAGTSLDSSRAAPMITDGFEEELRRMEFGLQELEHSAPAIVDESQIEPRRLDNRWEDSPVSPSGRPTVRY